MSEFERRLAILRGGMAAQGVDLVAVGPTENMRYLAGHVSHPDERLCLLLVSAETATVVVPSINAEEWVAHTELPLFRWADTEGPEQALGDALKQLSVRKLAVDGATRADFLLSLLRVAPEAEAITLASMELPLRLRKSAHEIEGLARAAEQADKAMQVAVDVCRPGATEAQVAWAAEEAFRLDGADEVCFTLVASGPNGARPHHHQSDRPLRQGESVLIDIGASFKDYKSDITRMVFLGEPPAEFLEAYAAVLEANERGRAAVKPGVQAQDVDKAARDSLESAGYGEYFIHRTGHGLGLEIHEPPWIIDGNSQALEEGMVFSVEPGVYFPGKFGIRIEDIAVVTQSGCRTLTGFDHQLVVK